MYRTQRKSGQGVRLTLPTGEQIRVVVDRPERGYVRLGIDAPASVVIQREEDACRCAHCEDRSCPACAGW